MSPTAPLLATLLLAISAAASPAKLSSSSVTLPLAKRFSASGGPINLVQQDRARVTELIEYGESIQSGKLGRRDNGSTVSIAQYNPSSAYIAAVGIGSPPTTYDLLVQLGTANTWVGNDRLYKQTATSVNTGESMGLYITGAFFSGEKWLDTFSFTSDLVIKKQTFGVSTESYGYDTSVDGVLGIAPTYMDVGTLWSQPQLVFPTITDNLYNQGLISENAFSLFFAPSISGNNTSGELIFGGIDPSKYTGEINYVPITSTSPSSNFWGLNQTITYGDKTIMNETAGVVESSITLIMLASNAYAAYKDAIGATEDAATQMLKLTALQYNNLRTLDFHIGPVTYALTPNGQIWPRALNTYIGGSNGAIYSVVGSYGRPSGYGFDFSLGQAFLERFYTTCSTTHQRIGFATTIHTEATTN